MNDRSQKQLDLRRVGGQNGHTALCLCDGALTAVCLSRLHKTSQQYMSVEGLGIPGNRLYVSILKHNPIWRWKLRCKRRRLQRAV
jgi:hypothetical protein